MRSIAGIGIAAIAIVLLVLILGPWTTVSSGTVGVRTSYGAAVDVLEPGFHFINPLTDGVEELSTQTQNVPFEFQAYSKDQQVASVKMSVTYHIIPSKGVEIYNEFRSPEAIETRIIKPEVNEQFKNVFGQFNAASAIQDRANLNARVQDALVSALSDRYIILESIQVEDISFSDAYDASIEARMQAEVEVQKLQQQLEQDKVRADQVRVTAAGTADAAVAAATGQAEATKLAGDADAYAIRARGEAEAAAIAARAAVIKDNPELVYLITAEKWNGILPTTMPPGGTVPFLNLSTTPAAPQ
jgi:regulator of protease activity HflC (stomatin/prohibitin superfamily)